MALTPDDSRKCPFPNIQNTALDQFLRQYAENKALDYPLRAPAAKHELLSQQTINNWAKEFTHWNRKISVKELADYVRERCQQGEVQLRVLLQSEKQVVPAFELAIPDTASYQSPDQRVNDGTNVAVTHREATDFLQVLVKDPMITLAFQILQSFVSDYIQQLGSEQECPYAESIFHNMADHYRRGDNFQRAIPVSIYIASPPDERASFTSDSLNSATAKRGLNYFQSLRMFSLRASDIYPEIIQALPEAERVFTCPAEPFLVKLFGETDVLETVVTFIRDCLEQKIILKVIPDPDNPESQPSSFAVPNAMSIVHIFTQSRLSLLAEYLALKNESLWDNLAADRGFRQHMELHLQAALRSISDDIRRPNSSTGERRPD